MKTSNIFLASLLMLVVLISCSSPEEKTPILDENFNTNTRGWIQENADFHTLEIKNGYYYIENSDTASVRTSCRSLDKSYLFSLPENYSIETSLSILDTELDTAYCGLILDGNSFVYEFTFHETGEVLVEEYCYNTKSWATYTKVNSLENVEGIRNFDVRIDVSGWNFELYLNDNWLGKGTMASKSWTRIAPFVGKFTAMGVDYIRINEIEE